MSFIVGDLLDESREGTDPLEADEVDSLGLTQLMDYIDLEFGVALDDEEMIGKNFASVPVLAAFIDSKRSQNSA